MSAPVVPLAPGVVRIPTMGDFINSFAFLDDDGQVTLVDCGVSKAPATIVAALEHLGKHPADVTRIILTHAHSDHAGGAKEMLDATGVDGVAIHEADVEFVLAGQSPPFDMGSTAGRLMSRLPGSTFAPFQVSTPLHDGDLIDVGGGLRVVHTPGHTPGHISLLHERTGVLITGDALFNPFSRMQWPMAPTCTSPSQNRISAALLADLDYLVAAFTHGVEIRVNAREAIRSFLTRKGAR
jgi:glyoxylase-like metal-dependent hydrolase (beta-lactamase superfamily II)